MRDEPWPDVTTVGPYELGVWIHPTLPPPQIVGIRARAGQEVAVRVGAIATVARAPGETTYRMCMRAAEAHGTREPFMLVYDAR